MLEIEVKEQIIKKYFDEHEKPSIIAKEFNVRPSYVTKIIQKDMKKYNAEKEYRNKIQKEQRKKDKRNWARKNREMKKELDDFVKKQHNQASYFLSEHKEISNLEYAKFNRSAYKYDNKTSGLKLKKGINAGFTVAKKLKNVIPPSFIKSKRIYV